VGDALNEETVAPKATTGTTFNTTELDEPVPPAPVHVSVYVY
jgi:hypothetical protein